MKQIFTLVAVSFMAFFCTAARGQAVQDFEGGLPSCFMLTNAAVSHNGGVDNSNSVKVSTTAVGLIATPFVNMGIGANVSAYYNAAGNFKAKGGPAKTTKIEIGTLDRNGIFTVLNNGGTVLTAAGTGTISGTVSVAGTYRVQIRVTQSVGTLSTFIDNLSYDGSYHYHRGNGPCNSAPVATNDIYNAPKITSAVTGNVLTDITSNGADSDPDTREVLSAVPQANVTLTGGALNLNADGTFTFTPDATFNGGPVTFTYTAMDNGFEPASATAIVTINYPVAPKALNDVFAAGSAVAISGNVITNTNPNGADKDANKAAPFNANAPTAVVVQSPQDGNGTVATGTFAFNANGNFTFTPTDGFKGGPITFTYKITDNTYTPLYSNIATVTLNYPVQTVLPVKLVSFTASTAINKVKLSWEAADNETGNYFEVLKSNDGRAFKSSGIVFSTKKPGSETYSFTDATDLSAATFYQLRIVNEDHSIAYSKTLMIRTGAGVIKEGIQLLQNPVGSNLMFTCHSVSDGPYRVSVYNEAGARVYTTNVALTKGLNTVSLELNKALNAGIYIMELAGTGTSVTTQFMKN